MALTLAQGNEYSTTEMQRAVIDRLVKDDPILERLGFVTILGNSLTYDTVTTDATARFYTVGETWEEGTVDVTPATAALVTLGGDADIDKFLLKTRSNKIDLQGTVIGNKVKAVKYKYLNEFYYGSASNNGFNGLHSLMSSTTYNTVEEGSGSSESVLNISKFRAAIDLIRGFKPELIVMTRLMRRSLSTYLDSIGDKLWGVTDQFGKLAQSFDGIPIAVSDQLLDTESVSGGSFSGDGTGGTATSIFILAFDDMAVTGIHDGSGVQTEEIGTLETKNAFRWRIIWNCGLMFQDLRSSAKVSGVDPDGSVAA